jgi:hypothetical protein
MQSRIRVLVLLAVGACARTLVAAGPDQLNGILKVTVADYFSEGRSETRYFIRESTSAGRTWEVHLANELPTGLRTGMAVIARGRIGGTLLEEAEVVSSEGRSPGSNSKEEASLPQITPITGVQRTLVYVLQTAGNPNNFTNSQIDSAMFAPSGRSVNTFYQENSFGSVSFAGDVVGPYTITDPDTCDELNIASQADKAAATAGVDITAYPHRVYLMPNAMMNVCTFGGISTLGGIPGGTWINTGFYFPTDNNIYVALEHELGHQLVMQHAQAIQSDGSLLEYGDNSCIMGDMAYYLVDFHVLHRIQEGWIPLSNIQQVNESGVYQVSFGEAQTSAVQAIQILPPGATEPLYITYRQPDGLDADLQRVFTGGASIDYWNGGINKTQLATYYPWGGALSDGQTYVSPNGKVRIMQIAHTSANVTVDVQLVRPEPSRR